MKIGDYMNYIDKKLKDKTEAISFIEIKENSNINIKGIDLSNIPLPILIDSLIEEVKESSGEEISLERVIDGIIYLLGIGDNEFPYIEEYKEIVASLTSDIKAKILFDSIEAFKEDNIEKSLINVRALLSLEADSIKGLFQYGIVLESIGNKLLEKEEIEDGEEVLRLSTYNFEKILDIDDKYALAYYKLGFHYRYLSQYVKSDLIWRKFLNFSDDDSLKEEVREELLAIEDEVNFETAITYLTYSDFKKALEALLKLMPIHKESWNVNYLLGKAYAGSGDIEMAIKYLNRAIDYNTEEVDLYNELGVLYYNIGDIEKAILVFTDGLKQSASDHKLLFNRSLMYSSLGDNKKALADAEEAFKSNPDPDIKTQIEWLKENV